MKMDSSLPSHVGIVLLGVSTPQTVQSLRFVVFVERFPFFVFRIPPPLLVAARFIQFLTQCAHFSLTDERWPGDSCPAPSKASRFTYDTVAVTRDSFFPPILQTRPALNPHVACSLLLPTMLSLFFFETFLLYPQFMFPRRNQLPLSPPYAVLCRETFFLFPRLCFVTWSHLQTCQQNHGRGLRRFFLSSGAFRLPPSYPDLRLHRIGGPCPPSSMSKPFFWRRTPGASSFFPFQLSPPRTGPTLRRTMEPHRLSLPFFRLFVLAQLALKRYVMARCLSGSYIFPPATLAHPTPLQYTKHQVQGYPRSVHLFPRRPFPLFFRVFFGAFPPSCPARKLELCAPRP